MDGKSLWKSKTFWFNLLALVVVIATAFGFADFQPSPEVEQIGMVVITIVNLLLRFMTKEPVKLG